MSYTSIESEFIAEFKCDIGTKRVRSLILLDDCNIIVELKSYYLKPKMYRKNGFAEIESESGGDICLSKRTTDIVIELYHLGYHFDIVGGRDIFIRPNELL